MAAAVNSSLLPFFACKGDARVMEVTYTLTKNDLTAFRRFHTRYVAKGGALNRLGNGFLVVLWAVLLVFIVQIAGRWYSVLLQGPRGWGFLFQTNQFLFVGFLVFSLFLAYVFWGQWRIAARLGPSAAQLSAAKHMRIGPDGVQVVTVQEQMQRAWSDIPHVRSDRDYIYLYTTSTYALVVPRRAFATPEHSQAFEAQARAFRADPYLSTAQKTEVAGDAAVWPPPPSFSKAQERPAAYAPELEDVLGALHLHYMTTKADIVRSQLFLLPRHPLILVTAFIPYAFAAFVWTLAHFPPAAAVFWTIIIAAFGALLTQAWLTYKMLNQYFARFPKGRPCHTVARSDLLCDADPDRRTILRWPEVSTVQMRLGDIYVLPKGIGGVVISRSAFANKAAAEAWTQQLRQFWQQGKDAPSVPPPAPAEPAQPNR